MWNSTLFEVSNVNDLNRLDAWVRYALETATRQIVDEALSRKVTFRLIGEKSWGNAVESVSYRHSAIQNSRAIHHYFLNEPPYIIRVYNLYRFLMWGSDFKAVEKKIFDTIDCIFGGEKELFLNTRDCNDLDYLYLIHKVDPSMADRIVKSINPPRVMTQMFKERCSCELCDFTLTPFGRCMNTSCSRFMWMPKKDDSLLPSLDYIPAYARNSDNEILAVDAAPFFESMIMDTNRVQYLSDHLNINNQLHPAYISVIRKFYNHQDIEVVSIDLSSFQNWVKRQRVKMANAINLDSFFT